MPGLIPEWPTSADTNRRLAATAFDATPSDAPGVSPGGGFGRLPTRSGSLLEAELITLHSNRPEASGTSAASAPRASLRSANHSSRGSLCLEDLEQPPSE